MNLQDALAQLQHELHLKVGFTVVGHSPDGKPIYVDDFRGALERNAMRYYLCIEAYLTSLSAPPDGRCRLLGASLPPDRGRRRPSAHRHTEHVLA